MKLQIKIAAKFRPLLAPFDGSIRYRVAYGGRASGKSWLFAYLAIRAALTIPSCRILCVREIQKTLNDSSKKLIETLIEQFGLTKAHGFEIMHDCIKLPNNGIINFIGLSNQSAENVKSLMGYNFCWCEESQVLSQRSLDLLLPTIREDNSEIWFSFNGRRKTDPVDQMFRGKELPSKAVIVQANWNDNPFFNDVMETERLDCLRLKPESYDHIWNGGYCTILTGSYYAQQIAIAKQEHRIGGKVSIDPLLPIKLAFDIGGTGAKADAVSIWAFQNIGKEIRVINHYEAVGQPLSSHVAWMREHKYNTDRVQIYLPHDGATQDKVFDVSYESSLLQAGYDVTVVPNQGKGAANARIECVRRQFPNMWFDEKCEAGIEALGWYHAKIDDVRGIDLGADHDWSSHSADSAGLMAIVSEQDIRNCSWRNQKIDYSLMDRQNV